MAEIIGAFLESPGEWNLIHKYGRDPSDSSLIHKVLRVNTTGSGFIVAPFAGTLSVKDPGGGQLDGTFPVPGLFDPDVPDRVDIYLHTHWASNAQEPKIKQRTESIGGFLGMVFLGVETASLEAALAEALDHAVLQGGTFASAKKERKLTKLPPFALTRARAVKMFAAGNLNIPIKAGHRLGRLALDPGGARTLAVAAVSRDGFVDPLYTYDQLGDLVVPSARADMNRFAQPGQTGWPVFPGILFEQLLSEAETTLFPYPPLAEFRRRNSVNDTFWRRLRDNQKALYLASLRAHVGQPPPGSTAPRFAFDTLDWRNPFQLEAVVEFYANYADPWKAGAAPKAPTDGGYRTVDFQNYDGDGATITSSTTNPPTTTLTFPAETQDMFDALAIAGGPNVPEKGNVIELSGDVARPSKQYLVTALDKGNRRMTIAGTPDLQDPNGNDTDTSSWTLHRRPIITVVDCFGGRVSGDAAKIVGEDIIELERPVPKVNKYFDTIYLESDTGSPSKAYRIVAFDVSKSHFQVVARGAKGPSGVHPDFGTGGTSQWRIPAGISRSLEPLGENLGKNDSPVGWDHFDGMLFVLKGGRVLHQARWNSFTSRNNDDPDFWSSIVGNRLYKFSSHSASATKPHINYAFEITDPNDTDHVANARLYFTPLRNNDPVSNDGNGKRGIRIHHSVHVTDNRGAWSSGCVVSPNFASGMRDVVIRLYLDEFKALNGKEDAVIAPFLGKGEIESMRLFKNDAHFDPAKWTAAKINGWFWLVRPDELPLDWVFTP